MSDSELAETLEYFEVKRARKEALVLLSLVKPAGGALANLIAEDFNRTRSFEGYEDLIRRGAKEGRKDFFIVLGKLLEGKRLKPNLRSKLDEDVAFILCLDPKINSSAAVKFLEDRGHHGVSKQSFKQMKYNWKRAAMKNLQRVEQHWRQFFSENSFLRGEVA